MNFESESPTLRTLLIDFLRGNEMIYPPMELNIVSNYPMQVVDDELSLIDLSSLQQRINREIPDTYIPHKLILTEWKYVLRRIPNSDQFYFDIEANKMEVVEDQDDENSPFDLGYGYLRLSEEPQIIFELETRRRYIIRKEFQENRKRRKRRGVEGKRRYRSRSNSKRERKRKENRYDLDLQKKQIFNRRNPRDLSKSISRKTPSVDGRVAILKRRQKKKKPQYIEDVDNISVHSRALSIEELAGASIKGKEHSNVDIEMIDDDDDNRSVGSNASIKSYKSYASMASHFSHFSNESIKSAVTHTSQFTYQPDELIDLNDEDLKMDEQSALTSRFMTPINQRNGSKSNNKRKEYKKNSHVAQRGYFINIPADRGSNKENKRNGVNRRNLRSASASRRVKHKKEVDFTFLKEKVRENVVTWKNIEFKKAHLKYLMNNKHLLEEPVEFGY